MTAAAPRAPQRWPPSVIPLLLVNAIPLVGVLAHHWTVFVVLLLYWCENVVVGAFNVLRMVCAYPQVSIAWVGKLFVIPFFMVHKELPHPRDAHLRIRAHHAEHVSAGEHRVGGEALCDPFLHGALRDVHVR